MYHFSLFYNPIDQITVQKNLLHTVFYVVLACFTFLSTSTPASAQNKSTGIIYETLNFTQKKGQSLNKAMQGLKLTQTQKKLIKGLPILSAAKSNRHFRLAFKPSGNRKLLREVKVTRQHRVANFVYSGNKFISQASKIKSNQIKSNSSKKQKKSNTNNTYSKQVYFTQAKGQSLSNAMRGSKLSALQQRLIKNLPVTKTARSKREFHLGFRQERQRNLLKAVKVIRGINVADYVLKKRKGNLVFVKGNSQINTNLSKAINKKISGGKNNKGKSNNKSSGNYRYVKFTQKKGQSINRAMQSSGLSSLQRRLCNKLPITKSAKSTRQFHLLFRLESGKKRLKAVKVIRGNNKAAFVLVKNKGKLQWANQRGQIIGQSQNTQSLRYPVNYSRISSHFNLRRRHPVSRRIRPHKGVDFKAPHGAAVRAPVAGIVTYAGRQRGYGKIVEINHQNGYRTKYAHLSHIPKGIRKGVRVRARQLIGKVGSTGISTGSHLHYEILVNGRARNPLRVRIPGSSNNTVNNNKISKKAKRMANLYLPKLNQFI